MCAYIEKIFGLEREDYDYHIVNILLEKEVKTFLKNVACYPEKINSILIEKVDYFYLKEELLHIILLVTNSKYITQLRFLTSRLYKHKNCID